MSEGKHHHPQHGAPLLSDRLVNFRRWLTRDAKCTVHPSLCIVNGEATDGTKNAPVLLYGPPTPAASARPKNHSGSSSASASKSLHSKGEGGAGGGAAGGGRCGTIDADDDWALWDRTMGCQVRTVRELKKGEVAFDVPQGSMITPDVVAASDAGRAVLACCDVAEARAGGGGGAVEMWDVFAGAAEATRRQLDKISHQSGTQLLVTILRERKKAEDVVAKARRDGSLATGYSLVPPGKVSSRAPFLAFLLQQRFCSDDPEVASSVGGTDLPAGPALPSECPHTFAPYALTLPAVAPSPLCWKRNELALLAGCLAGTKPLQELASRTLLLSSDLIQLVRAGLLHRFPNLFPPGAVTWDTWVWAASMWESRTFPATCYLNKGETVPLMLQTRINSHQGVLQELGHQQTPASPSKATETVWDDMGVVVPLLDMLNHETEAAQITWETPHVTEESAAADGTMGEADDAGDGGGGAAADGDVFPHPRAVTHKRVKKGCQVYNNYGALNNQDLIVQYGFAHIGNGDDEMGVSWGFADAVGGVPMPSSYEPYAREVAAVSSAAATTKGDDGVGGESAVSSDLFSDKGWVFESSDPASISRWWTPDRLQVLAQEANLDDSFIDKLTKGKKLSGVAYLDGLYHPIILSAAVVATMSVGELTKHTQSNGKSCVVGDGDGTTAENGQHGSRVPIHIKKGHQQRLRRYLEFFYVRKLEKLLSNMNLGLKDHFNNVQIWARATEGGLHYKGGAAGGNSQQHHPPAGGESMGWQTFFDSFAYNSAMEVEKRYYAMGADSCVLTLYDGSLRCIQTSIDGTSEEELPQLWKQLKSVGFVISDEEEEEEKEEKPAEEVEQKETDIVEVKEEEKEPAADKGVDALNHDAKQHASEATSSGTVTSVGRTDRVGNVSDSFRENHIKSETGNGSSNNDAKLGRHDDAKLGRHDRGHSGYNRYGGFPGDQMGNNSGFGRDRRRIKAKGPAPVCVGSGGSGTGIGIPRPPAIKLHIGNLSYSTLPAELYEFFSNMYGASNVLECHIPTERETGKSRGFGFVTMPENVALKALESDKKHEIEGRVLKVARSNTAGSGKTSAPAPAISSDRCATCGYRPKYCTCMVPKLPGGPGGSGGPIAGAATGTGFGGPPWEEVPTHDAPHGHRPYAAGDRESGWGRSRSWNRGRQSYSPSPSSRLSSSRSDNHRHRGRDRNYHERRQREYRRSRSYSYSRSRSPSSSRDRDRGRDRRRRSHGSRRKWRSRSRSRSWSRSRSRSRHSVSRSRSRSRSRTRSRSYDKGSPRKKDGDRMPPQSRGRSRSPSISRSKGTGGGSAEKKRSGKKRGSRSRSRSRSRGHGSRRKRRKSRSHSNSR